MCVSSFFINVLQKQSLLVHGTSSRWHLINGEKNPFFFFSTGDGELFFEHQKIFLNSLGIEKEAFFRVYQVHGNHVYVLKDLGAFWCSLGGLPPTEDCFT